MIDQIVFYFFAALAVISAVLVVTRRNVVQSAIFLITALVTLEDKKTASARFVIK